MTTQEEPREPRLPPRWFIELAWKVHRALFRHGGGARWLRRPRPGRWGMMRVTTTGRRSGQERPVILGYVEDGDDLVEAFLGRPADPESFLRARGWA